MQKRNSMIIRLIDVVMILLLGFINISDIIHKNDIKLPSMNRSSRRSQTKETLKLRVHIVPSDTVIKELKDERSNLLRGQQFCYYLIEQGGEATRIRFLDKLEKQLYNAYLSDDSLLVIIAPDSNSIIQGTISLIDICRKYNIRRMFDYK